MKKIYLICLFVLSISAVYSQNIPVDFEPGGFGETWTWTCFENDTNPPLEIIANPDPTGLNTSSTVAKFTALQAGNPWAGCETMHGADIGTFVIDSSNYIVRIMVWKNKISNVGIKLVTSTAASLGEILVPNTLINQWEQLTFDFSAHIGGMTYDQLVIFPDFEARTDDNVIYFDNVFGAAAFLDIEETQESDIQVYPNPTNGVVHIQSENNIDKLEVFSLDGKLLLQVENMSSFDLSAFEIGTYILQTNHNGQVSSRRIVKN